MGSTRTATMETCSVPGGESCPPVLPPKGKGNVPAAEVRGSFLRKPYAGDLGAHCHAARFRFDTPFVAAEVRRNFDFLMSRLSQQPGGAQISAARLWTESVAAGSESAMAASRRQREMNRAVDGVSGPGWRAVVLEYEDGIADLVLVAHRAVLDASSLSLLAAGIMFGESELFCSNAPELELVSAPRSSNHVEKWRGLLDSNACSPLDWCTSSHPFSTSNAGRYRCEAGPGADIRPETFIAAAGAMVARYGNLTPPVIASLAAGARRKPGEIGPLEGLALIPLPIEETASAGLMAAVSKALEQPECWHTQEVADHLAKSDAAAHRVLAVFVVDEEKDFCGCHRPQEYLPFLASPYPLALILYKEATGHAVLECMYSGKDLDVNIIAQFTRSVVHACALLSAEEKAEIEILNEAEQQKVAALARPAHAFRPWRDRIERAFAQAARQLPGAPALSFGKQHLTYSELERRANRIAQALRECGVKDRDRVGVCLERSVDLVAVLLAVMKAGATYVPMDPAYPDERLAFISSDADVSLVVASNPCFPAPQKVPLLTIEELNARAEKLTDEPVPSATTFEDIAYIIYTSGSTGRPKGVAVPHRNVLSLLAATIDDFALSSRDVWTFFHSSAFDFSVWEIWGCLLTGGRLVVVPYWISRAPAEFGELLVNEGVTILNQTPSAFSQLIEADRIHPLRLKLRLVIFAGEPLNTRMLLPWFDRHPETQCRLVNMFGITETTVHVTAKTVTRKEALDSSRSVGRALPGWYVYVMDPQGRVLPTGIPGEICVGGEGVALHYVNRADLTAQRFVPDPFTAGRMYRSGDKGVLQPDGQLEHLGRMDSQVKIRGFRVEVDEIQAVLLAAPGVQAAAVVFRQDDPNDAASARLNAYVVIDGTTGVNEIRASISRVLPEYMLPASITVVPALPLTGNGKLDVKRLPEPAAPEAPVETSNLSPGGTGENPDEKLANTLRNIWGKVLKAQVGLDDNFFDLGGNSLYAVRIAATMREQGLPAVPLRDIYVHQTIRRIALALGSREKSQVA